MSTSAPKAITNLACSLSDVVPNLPIVAVLTWIDPNVPSAGCLVSRTRSSDPSCNSYNLLAVLAGGITTFTDETLSYGSEYRYKVVALPVNKTIYTPAAPTFLEVSTDGAENHIAIGLPSPDGSGNAISAPKTRVVNGDESGSNEQPFNPETVVAMQVILAAEQNALAAAEKAAE